MFLGNELSDALLSLIISADESVLRNPITQLHGMAELQKETSAYLVSCCPSSCPVHGSWQGGDYQGSGGRISTFQHLLNLVSASKLYSLVWCKCSENQSYTISEAWQSIGPKIQSLFRYPDVLFVNKLNPTHLDPSDLLFSFSTFS